MLNVNVTSPVGSSTFAGACDRKAWPTRLLAVLEDAGGTAAVAVCLHGINKHLMLDHAVATSNDLQVVVSTYPAFCKLAWLNCLVFAKPGAPVSSAPKEIGAGSGRAASQAERGTNMLICGASQPYSCASVNKLLDCAV
jgi:hypothetical protein